MKAAGAVLAFTAVTVLAGVAAGFLTLDGFSAWLTLALGVAAGVAAWFGSKDPAAPRPGFWGSATLLIFALASARAFLWLIFSRQGEWCVLSPNNLGDLSLHLNYIRYLASGVPFWPENPILAGTPMSYPLGADLLNSILTLTGVPVERGLIWTGLAGAALTGWALWRWGGAFTVAAFLFNGGLAGFALFRLWQFDDFQQNLIWKNFFLSMFVTQRGLLFALPAGLLLLTSWRESWFRRGVPLLPLWLRFLLYIAMPVFSLHAFLFLSLILLAGFLWVPAQRKNLLLFVGAAFLPATLFTALVTGGFSASAGLRFELGWMMADLGWWAWIWNFGLTLPLLIALLAVLFRDRDTEARCFVGTAALLFAACSVAAFAPWTWDNMKLMLWCWLAMAPFLWSKILLRLNLPARAAVCFVLFLSGAVSLIGGLDHRHGYPIAKRQELDAWRKALEALPATDRIACVPDYNHPVILLGRKVVCGYEGHLWSHGLPFRETLDSLKGSLSGEIPWSESAEKLTATWLAVRADDNIEPPEEMEFPPAGFYGEIYDLRPLFKSNSSNPKLPPAPPRSVD